MRHERESGAEARRARTSPVRLRSRFFRVAEALLDEPGEAGDRAEVLAGCRFVLHFDAELAFEHHDDLERVDRIEPETSCEQRLVIADVIRGHVFELQALDE